jgi:V/A-type H+-transporting ATPase subunit I
MAVLQMNKICICAVKKDRKKILEFLQRQGCVEVSDIGSADDVFSKEDTSSVCALLKKNSEMTRDCLSILNRYSPEKSSGISFLKGRSRMTVAQSDDFVKRRNEVFKTAQRILSLERSIAEAKAELLRIEAREEALVPWMKLPMPQTFKGTKRTAVFIGSVEGEYTLESLMALLSRTSPELDLFHLAIVSSSKVQTCFYLIVLKKDAELAQEALRLINFAAPVTPSHHMPQDKKERLLKQKQQAQALIDQAEQEIKSYAGMRGDLRFLEDHMKMRSEKYGVIQRLRQSKHAFVLNGYIPQQQADELQQKLVSRFDCAVQTESAMDDKDVPIKLKNSRFAEPVESVIESYSMPDKSEIDPAGIMSIFYYILFGLMFSDAGYGLIMAGVCGACLLLYKNMEDNWKRNLRLFFWCGVSTLFWGIIFSSYFGDVVNVVSRTFFGHEVSIPPVWFLPLDNPMRMLVFCLGLGCLHLTTGYLIKAGNLAKGRHYIDIVFDVVFPVAILVCLLLMLMGSDMFYTMSGFTVSLSPVASNICTGVVLVCIVGIFLTGGRESRNWFKRLLKGLYALYNVLAGWLGDILSYSRLLALGLATGVIASVFNSLGTMTGTGVVGLIGFIVVFVIGHALNFGINVLGAYVHSNRLAYVEFFSKFYEGGGRKFTPYGMHTKYYRIVEEGTDNV